jgi:catechol 2,3-dioxygenase-like lactoylglutathione lyase family enzyme
MVIPVSDVERAKEFYKKLGWRLDVTRPSVVQFTPPGSWCSVQFGKTLTAAAPGSGKGYLIISDIVAAREQPCGAVRSHPNVDTPGKPDRNLVDQPDADLASALRRAAAARGQHEKRIGAADANWPDWYAEHMVREQTGQELPQ